jgi:cytochrome c biogenesis protein CcmG, thiol:disulfide interchange protein DsbE
MAAMTPARLAMLIAAAALAVLVGVGVGELVGSRQGTSSMLAKLTPGEMAVRLSGSPPALTALHDQAGELLAGGWQALQRRLAALRGYPVVINKWASWCAPCRAEFPIFQHAAVDLGRRVAFIGLDSGDSQRSGAAAFLRSFPVSYPSYYDPSGRAGEQLTYSSFTPVTVFFSREGSVYRHQGPYPSVQKLERDVERYGIDA